jgi:hypothetical protein
MKFKELVKQENNKGDRKFKIIVSEVQFRKIIDSLVSEHENKALINISSLKNIQDGK